MALVCLWLLFAFLLSPDYIVFLICAAGKRKGSDEAKKGPLDKIPFDIYTAIMAAVVLLLVKILHGRQVALPTASLAALLLLHLFASSLQNSPRPSPTNL